MASESVDPQASQDPVRTYSLAENERLTANLVELAREIQSGVFRGVGITVSRLLEIHRRLFDGVRSHGGKTRAAVRGQEYVTFGPNRSAHRDDIEGQLDAIFETVRRSIDSANSHPDGPDYDHAAIHIAIWLHAEIIRIHPFEDGNGRSSRCIMDLVLVELGLRSIPVDTVKNEYNDCLNEYFSNRNIQPLVDLFIRLAADSL